MSASALRGHIRVGPLGGESEPGWAEDGRTDGWTDSRKAIFVQSKHYVKVLRELLQIAAFWGGNCYFYYFRINNL